MTLKTDIPQFSRAGYVLNSGEIVLLASGCAPKSLNTTGIAVYDTNGQLIWQKSLDELLPEQKALFDQGPDYSRWNSDQRLHEGSSLKDAYLEIVLLSQDIIRVHLASGEVAFQSVENAVLFVEPKQAIARARYLSNVGNTNEALAILEAVHAKIPSDYEAGEALARLYEGEHRYAEAVHVLDRVGQYFPLDGQEKNTSSEDWEWQSPIRLRGYIAELYIKNKQYSEARQLLETLYPLRPFNLSIVNDYADVLFTLDDDATAIQVLKRIYEQRYEKAREIPQSLSSLQYDVDHIIRLLDKHQRPELAKKFLAGLSQLEGEDQDQWYLTQRGDTYQKAGNYAQAVSYYERAAAKSVNGEPEFKLAELYREHPSLAENHLDKAIDWYLKAAEKPKRFTSFSESPEIALCYLYRVEKTGTTDFEKSFHWCQEAAKHGLTEGLFWVAIYFGDERSPHYLPTQAIAQLRSAQDHYNQGWYSPADNPTYSFKPEGLLKEHYVWAADVLAGPAFRDDPVANYILGEFYDNGRGVEEDVQAAKVWFQKSANAGYAKGMLSLANLYWKKTPYETHEEYIQLRKQAFHWYEQAAAHGDEWGYYYMAELQMGKYLGDPDLPAARQKLDWFTEKYLEKERIRKSKYSSKDSWHALLDRSNPAERLYRELEELEAKASQKLK